MPAIMAWTVWLVVGIIVVANIVVKSGIWYEWYAGCPSVQPCVVGVVGQDVRVTTGYIRRVFEDARRTMMTFSYLIQYTSSALPRKSS